MGCEPNKEINLYCAFGVYNICGLYSEPVIKPT